MNAKILETIERIEKAEGVWEQNQSWEDQRKSFDYGLKTKYASIPRSTGKILSNLVIQLKPKIILEIGSSVGYSTLWLALAAEQIEAKIIATEINSFRIDLAKQHFEMAGVQDLITLVPKDAHTVLAELKETGVTVDLVFLDAFKKEYPLYIDELYPILGHSGTIIIDNVNSHANLLNKLFEKLSNDWRYIQRKIDQDNGILVLTKN